MTATKHLVALRLNGRALADAIASVWSAGDAAFPVDPALPELEVERLLRAARPDRVIDASGERALTEPLPTPDGVALVVATSGTTAAPKLVELTHDALGASAKASAARIGSEPGERWLCCVPLHHIAGLGILVRSNLAGTSPIVHERFDLDAFDATRDATLVSLVPTMLVRLLDAGADLGRFRVVLLGGAGVPSALVQRARDAGANVVVTYGMTETCGGCVYDGIALDGVDVRIEPDGTIALRGPVLMRGYRGAPEHGGWLRTADAGEIADGRLRVLGRVDDVIVTGGKKVMPGEVEDVLAGHPNVADVAVFGREDPEGGSRVVAAIVPRHATPSLDDVRTWLTNKLATHELPRELVIVPSIPRNRQGKPVRPWLEDL